MPSDSSAGVKQLSVLGAAADGAGPRSRSPSRDVAAPRSVYLPSPLLHHDHSGDGPGSFSGSGAPSPAAGCSPTATGRRRAATTASPSPLGHQVGRPRRLSVFEAASAQRDEVIADAAAAATAATGPGCDAATPGAGAVASSAAAAATSPTSAMAATAAAAAMFTFSSPTALSTVAVASPEASLASVRRQLRHLLPIALTLRELETRAWASQSLALSFRWQIPFSDRIGRSEVLEALVKNAEAAAEGEAGVERGQSPLAAARRLRSNNIGRPAPAEVGVSGTTMFEGGADLSLLPRVERLELLMAPAATHASAAIREAGAAAVVAPLLPPSFSSSSSHPLTQRTDAALVADIRNGTTLVASCEQATFFLELLRLAPSVSRRLRDAARSLARLTPLRLTGQYFKLLFAAVYAMLLAPPLQEKDAEEEEEDKGKKSSTATANCIFLALEMAGIDWIEAVSSSGKAFENMARDPHGSLLDMVLLFFHEVCCVSGDYVNTHRGLLHLRGPQRDALCSDTITPPKPLKRERDRLFASLHCFLALVTKIAEAVKFNHESAFRDSVFLRRAVELGGGTPGQHRPLAATTWAATAGGEVQADTDGADNEDDASLFHPSFKVFIEGKRTILVPQVGSASVARLVAAARVRAVLALARTRRRLQGANRGSVMDACAAERRERLRRERSAGGGGDDLLLEVWEGEGGHDAAAARPGALQHAALLDRTGVTSRAGRERLPTFFESVLVDASSLGSCGGSTVDASALLVGDRCLDVETVLRYRRQEKRRAELMAAVAHKADEAAPLLLLEQRSATASSSAAVTPASTAVAVPGGADSASRCDSASGVVELLRSLDACREEVQPRGIIDGAPRKRRQQQEQRGAARNRSALPALLPRATTALEQLPDREQALLGSRIENRSTTLRRFANFVQRTEEHAEQCRMRQTQRGAVADRKRRAYLRSLPPELRMLAYY